MAGVPKESMRVILLRALEMIEENIEAGIDGEGKPFKPYSTKTFAMPSGAMPKRTLKKLLKDGIASEFKTKAGSLWVIINGGYAAFKKARTGSDKVNLSVTGQMLRDMTIVEITDSYGKLGFTTPDSAEKAYYLNIGGRSLYKFFDLTEEQRAELTQMAVDKFEIDF